MLLWGNNVDNNSGGGGGSGNNNGCGDVGSSCGKVMVDKRGQQQL